MYLEEHVFMFFFCNLDKNQNNLIFMGRKRKAEISQEGDVKSKKDFENGHNNGIINSKKVKPNNSCK